jgi:hypothetical protein
MSNLMRAFQSMARAVFRACLVEFRNVTSSVYFTFFLALRSTLFRHSQFTPHNFGVVVNVKASGEAAPSF